MTKTIPEITDEMVDKAHAEYYGQWAGTETSKSMFRAILTAAITPEPEIEVTEAMLDAGNEAWNQCSKDLEPSEAARNKYLDNIMRAIYRAMVKAAPNGAKSAPQGVSAGAPEKETGRRMLQDRRFILDRRRSTDPK
jgi:hypothetical protein